MLQKLTACFWSFPRSFLRFFWMIAYVWLLLLAHDRLKQSVTSRTIRSYECKSSTSTVQGKFTLWSYISLPSFYALVPILKHCMIRKCLTCGYWEVDDEVEPITCFIIKPLRVTSTLRLYCHAMLVDVVWVWVYPWQMWDYYLMVNLRWLL